MNPLRIFQSMLLLGIPLFSTMSQGATLASLEKRLNELEARIEQVKAEKLSDCQLTYHYFTTVTNDCPENTVVRKAFLLGASGPIKLDCYYYQLACKINGERRILNVDQ